MAVISQIEILTKVKTLDNQKSTKMTEKKKKIVMNTIVKDHMKSGIKSRQCIWQCPVNV